MTETINIAEKTNNDLFFRYKRDKTQVKFSDKY